MRDRERDFRRRREEATIRGGGCSEPALPIWFRPKSEKVRVWVWGKLGKRKEKKKMNTAHGTDPSRKH